MFVTLPLFHVSTSTTTGTSMKSQPPYSSYNTAVNPNCIIKGRVLYMAAYGHEQGEKPF